MHTVKEFLSLNKNAWNRVAFLDYNRLHTNQEITETEHIRRPILPAVCRVTKSFMLLMEESLLQPGSAVTGARCMAQGGICRRQSVILLLTLHYIFWLEYQAKCKCCCKFLQKCRVLRRDAAEDGPVPVKLVRFTSILLYTFVSDQLGLNSKYIRLCL